MLRKVLSVVAVLAIASSAMAVSIQSIGVLSEAPTPDGIMTGTSSTPLSSISAISSDGSRVSGSSVDELGRRIPMTWSLGGGMLGYATKGAGHFTGIDQKAGGAVQTAANAGNGGAGNWTYAAANWIGRMGSPTSVSVLAPNSDCTTGSLNTASATADGLDGYVVGEHTGGTTSKGDDAYVWKVSNGLAPYKNYFGSGKTRFTSVSSNGIAIGRDRGGMGRGADRAIWYNAETNQSGSIPGVTMLVTTAQGNGISDDGTKMTGYMYPDMTNRLQAFAYTMGGSTVGLLPAGGDIANEQSVGYDVLSDGTVVGYTWDGVTRGAIWLPDGNGGYLNGGKAFVLQDLLANAPGISDWTRLDTAKGVALNGNGEIVIVGDGIWAADGTTRGYYITIPEPASLAFLALGGLAMLRRRR